MIYTYIYINQQTSTILLRTNIVKQKVNNLNFDAGFKEISVTRWNLFSTLQLRSSSCTRNSCNVFPHQLIDLSNVGNKRGVRDRLGVIAGVWWYLYQYPLIETLSSVYSKLFPLPTLSLVHFTLGSDSGKRPTWDILALCRLFVS